MSTASHSTNLELRQKVPESHCTVLISALFPLLKGIVHKSVF